MAETLLSFMLKDQTYALRLECVVRVIRAAYITALPKSPPVVLGIINIAGSIVPVLNIRARFGLSAKKVSASDLFIIAKTRGQTVALLVDQIGSVARYTEEQIVLGEKLPGRFEYIEGVVKLGKEMILIHDLDSFLSSNEREGIQKALSDYAENGCEDGM
ncbi:chemotaxis protein CheW [Chitinispirillales bacterium ANBcel5]|uniref:chemotaxis protein CheW n=1 Tax=Cellulosispirillum alkaliphilum TaxID=3039283 RepID=UPI002A551111|nr:chemotaxis protein CheW [Chitinispirillales bacterium ANBcel5]